MLPNQRLVSLDAFRGFVMLLMASSGFGLAQMASANPDVWWWQQIKYQVSHAPWQGCALWDLIQPSFMFMVGIAVPLSVRRRREEGQGFFKLGWHALIRAAILVLLAVLLSTGGSATMTNWSFPNVLAQIGLGYAFLVLLAGLGWEYCMAAIILILGGYWYWFFQHPLPSQEQLAAIQVAKPPAAGLLEGFFAHWNIHTNAAAEFDRWFLNEYFPRSEPFTYNAGGYQTLNFIPSLATMLGGAITGNHLLTSQRTHGQKCARLLIVGIVCLLIGTILGIVACPVIKRIWTPSWAIFSGGWVLLMLSFFYWLVEIAGQRKIVFPLVVVGMNSIFIYVMHNLCAGWISQQLSKHGMAALFATAWGPVIEKCSVLAVLWFMCFWLYRQRAFLRI
jgi:heparan-alpha-glucosaminide N-acetyltransferase